MPCVGGLGWSRLQGEHAAATATIAEVASILEAPGLPIRGVVTGGVSLLLDALRQTGSASR